MAKPKKLFGHAIDDVVQTLENVPVLIDALANDRGAGVLHSVNQDDLWSASKYGTWFPLNDGASARINGGMIEYDPGTAYDYLQVGEQAAATFSYASMMKNGQISVATVAVTIHGENDAPVAWADGYSTEANKTLVVDTKGVLANDSDPDSAGLVAVLVDGPAHGELDLNEDGTFEYTPDPNYAGQDSFTYKANDGMIDGNTVTVTIGVDGAEPDSYATDEDMVLTVAAADGVLANDIGVGKATTAFTVNLPIYGTLAFNPDGSFTYTPFADFYGKDSFTYQSSDGSSSSAITTVELIVAPALDPTSAQTGVVRFFTEDLGFEPWLFDGSNFQALDLTPGTGSTFGEQFFQAGDKLFSWHALPGVQSHVDSIDADGNTHSYTVNSQNLLGTHGRLFAALDVGPAELDPDTGDATLLNLPFGSFNGFAVIGDSLFASSQGGLSRLDFATNVWTHLDVDDAIEVFRPTWLVGDYIVGGGFLDGGLTSAIVAVDANTGQFQTIVEGISTYSHASITPSNGDLYFMVGKGDPADFLVRMDDKTGTGEVVAELWPEVTFQPEGPDDGIYVTGRPRSDLDYGLYRIDPETYEPTLLIEGIFGNVVEFQGEHYLAKTGDLDSAIYKWDQSAGEITYFHDIDPERIFEELHILGVVNGELAVSWKHNDDRAIWTFDGKDWEPHFAQGAAAAGEPLLAFDGDYLNEALGPVITFPIA